MFQKIICWLRDHKKCSRGTPATSHYIKIPAGRGAFCRDPEQYRYAGRLYRCARCGELLLIHGVLSWELGDLITTTLADRPEVLFDNAFFDSGYDFARIYK